jgi:predicted metalloprotease
MPRRDFVARVLGTTERAWEDVFAEHGAQYDHPTLQLFSDSTRSACGLGAAAMGPFYCPGDSTIYIDLSFFRDLENRLDAPGDFAQAYVIAHEVGHHVQNLTGTLTESHAQRANLPAAEANEISVRVELQADCYAGIWAHAVAEEGTILEDGDIEEGMNAASAIGDDRLQRQSQGHVVPESFTHGTSEQRVRWFRRGLEQRRPRRLRHLRGRPALRRSRMSADCIARRATARWRASGILHNSPIDVLALDARTHGHKSTPSRAGSWVLGSSPSKANWERR